MGLNVTVTANEAFADSTTVDRAALRRAAKPTVSVTGSISAAEVGDEAISNAKLAHMAANSVKVRDDYAVGDPSDKVVANTQILIGDGGGFTAAALSGDVTMANTGVVTIAANSVEGPMLHDNTADGVSVERGGSGGTLRVKAEGISLAHLADGTAKTVLGYDQNGAAAVIPAGAAGTILTANASTPPTFQANSGAMKLLAYTQSTVSHTAAATNPNIISYITIPANHGFSHVMIEADVSGTQHSSAGASWAFYVGSSSGVGGTKVKEWVIPPEGTGAATENLTTVTWINAFPIAGGEDVDTEVALNKIGAPSTYETALHGWRIWGLTAPS